MIKDRSIQLEGATNMRDLGGLQATDGREVKAGMIFRADALHSLTDADMKTTESIGIATVIDLRSSHELRQTGKARLVESGATYHNLPLSEYDPSLPVDRDTQITMGESYAIRAQERADTFAEILRIVADPENLPVVFHCAGGKDRTGMTAAMIYSILGVDRDTIIADYVLTNAAMERMIAAMSEEQCKELAKYPPAYLRADAEHITRFLDFLDTTFGSVENWLREAGIDDAAMDRLREVILA